MEEAYLKRFVILGAVFALIIGFLGVSLNQNHAEADTYYRDWDNVEQLQYWVDRHVTFLIIVGDDGVASFDNFQRTTIMGLDVNTSDCDEYARKVQELAIKDGYYLPIALTDVDGNVGPVKVNSQYHMGNLAIIGNDMYFVDPLKTSITYIGPLD
jgi:hypothetical protein